MEDAETRIEPPSGAADGDRLAAWAARIRASAPELVAALESAESLEEARSAAYELAERMERLTYRVDEPRHPLELAMVRTCAAAFRSIIAPSHEIQTGESALECLWRLTNGTADDLPTPVTEAFVEDASHLLAGLSGRSHIYGDEPLRDNHVPDFMRKTGRAAARARSRVLDDFAADMEERFGRYPSGLDPELAARRAANRTRILECFGAREADWQDYQWHLDNVVTKPEQLFELVEVQDRMKRSMRRAAANRLPIGITPYYVSLMDFETAGANDAAIRAQVMPPPDYVEAMAGAGVDRSEAFDFMGEHDTSPVELVTRRYARICILKPYNTCSQICVYCQRNWEIGECMADDAMAEGPALEAAIEWIARHPAIGEVLVTGGDPMVMDDEAIEDVLGRIAAIGHVYRIRIGSRTPVVLPFRWTERLADILGRLHDPGRREVALVTHFEHSAEVTAEAMAAVQRLRRRGIGVYNQQVFTTFNSRRFETAKLRVDLKRIGVDPYYTFNAKGKEETRQYRVPVARILQERSEEARLLPGLDRTDEPVFNVPRLGKNHLRARQDRTFVMLAADGSRIYEFHPWEKFLDGAPTYVHVDLPIKEYLDRLAARGEDPEDYRTIWYYY